MMWASFLAVGLMAAGPGSVASPAPAATPPVIVTVVSSPLCSAVRTVALPVGYVTRRNDEAFAAAGSVLGELARNNPDAGKTTSAAAGDLPQVVTPSNTASMTRIRQLASAISQNLMLERDAISKSWRDSPAGRDPKIDALRQRLINLMDLQDALDNVLTSASDSYFDNGDGRSADSPLFLYTLQARVFGASAALQRALADGSSGAQAAPVAHDVARYGSPAKVGRELGAQEAAFSHELAATAASCGL